MVTEQDIVFAPLPTRSRFRNLTGQPFGQLTVLGYAGYRQQPKGVVRQLWWCRCNCGTVGKFAANNLRSGNSRQCDSGAHRRKHGRAGTAEYVIWQGMKARCLMPNRPFFYRYGGRGIKVCKRWLKSFENFFADMGERPSPKHTLERIDNEKNYNPRNCRWATRKEQSRNTSINHWITFRGETMCIMDWAKRLGMPYPTLFIRIQRWPLERALTEPHHPKVARPREE